MPEVILGIVIAICITIISVTNIYFSHLQKVEKIRLESEGRIPKGEKNDTMDLRGENLNHN
ncbi:MAG: hypothetical protein GX308_10120 [Epulopiscium sp.]|nr:hypothetical protein [Candidatus Epulonipiscium sp.]